MSSFSRNNFRILVVASLCLCLQPLVIFTLASEADVHYGLTYWLARQAGFDKQSAERVAHGDYQADLGHYNPAPWVVAFHIILDGDVEAAKSVRDTHFASFQDLPAPPPQRAVVPNSPAARKKAGNSVLPPASGEPLDYSLDQFGYSLHPLQDSWAHQGIPDIPFRPGRQVHPELSFSHPAARGGWLLHNADITCLDGHPAEVVASAKASYQFMLEFLKTHPAARAQKSAEWDNLDHQVLTFAKACTKKEKLAWFNSDPKVPFSDYGDQNFIQTISTPGILSTLGPLLLVPPPHGPEFHAKNRQFVPLSAEAREAVQNFFENWLVKQDIPAAMQYMNIDALAPEVSALRGSMAEGDTREGAKPATSKEFADVQEWAQKFLILWLIKDHGMVNRMGHGVPSSEGYAALPYDIKRTSDALPLVHYESLNQAIYAPENLEGSELPYFAAQDSNAEKDTSPRAFVVFQFNRLPYDTLLLSFSKTPQGWKISRMNWIVL
jgi:hypothetical protein